MQNENLENQSNQIRRNPSRNNTNVNQGQGHEKRFIEENEENRSAEINPSEYDRSESDVDGGGVSDSSGDQGHKFSGGEATLERGFSGKPSRQVPQGSPNSGSQIQKEQQQAQQQSGESIEGDPDSAGAGAGYGSELGTGGQGQKLMGEDSDKNRNSGTAPGSNMGELQNANRGGQKSGQFNQSQDDSRRQ